MSFAYFLMECPSRIGACQLCPNIVKNTFEFRDCAISNLLTVCLEIFIILTILFQDAMNLVVSLV